MKSNDFIKKKIVENKLIQDHEVEMARSQLYFAAKAAIELHGVLKHITEDEGLEGWVQAKITKASDYLQAVHHYLLYQEKTEDTPPPEFDFNIAESVMQHVLENAGGVGAGSFAIAIPNRGGSVNGFANGGPGTVSRAKKKKVREAAPAANVAAPAGGTTTATPAAGAAPAKPGTPAPTGAAPAAGAAPAKPGTPAPTGAAPAAGDRKSTRLNSSH